MPIEPQTSVEDSLLSGHRFVRACLRKPVDRTPVWFLRQAGRYMQEYRDVRKHHTLVEICKQPEIAAEVTITAAEKLGVDAAIIFADLLLPLEPMGLAFEFQAGEGPVVHHPVRTADDVRALRTDRADELAYVARAIEKVAAHFRDRLGIIGFCGAPYTLASYMIEGGGSRNYIDTKQMMYGDTTRLAHASRTSWSSCSTEYCRLQVQAGADVIQIFDSWVGSLSLGRLPRLRLRASKRLVRAVQAMGVPVIYFGVETAGLLGAMASTGADVIGLDWRQPLDEGWRAVGHSHAVQGNLDPITLFAPVEVLEQRVKEILARRQRPPRPHLQPRPRHRSQHAGRECAGRGAEWCASFAWERRAWLSKPSCCSPTEPPRPSTRFPNICATWSAAAPCRSSGRRDSAPLLAHRPQPAHRNHHGAGPPGRGRTCRAAGDPVPRLRGHAQLASLHPRRGAADARRRH